jgi:UDP-glucose 4-epimerase
MTTPPPAVHDPAARVLVTGGAGYIGSHAAKALLAAGRSVVIVDDLSVGNRGAIKALRAMSGLDPTRLTFIHTDIADADALAPALAELGVADALHFAAFAQVGESVDHPLTYYDNNVGKASALLRACFDAGVRRFVFSSTCATYGEPPAERIPIAEDCPQHPVNPYGSSKRMFERVLDDALHARERAKQPFACAKLRYFNVAGCDREGMLGEAPKKHTRIIPIVLETLLGKRDHVTIFGNDYPTPDGTCIRDYIHVDDLVDAHLRVLDALDPNVYDNCVYNLGTGRGASVREIVDAVERVAGRDVPQRDGDRRPGDPPELYADPSKIERDLGWRAQITDLDEIVRTAWAWMQRHPDGYA